MTRGEILAGRVSDSEAALIRDAVRDLIDAIQLKAAGGGGRVILHDAVRCSCSHLIGIGPSYDDPDCAIHALSA